MSGYVDIARQWIGTPYLHQSACKGAGCDCLGLLLGIAREAGHAPPVPPPYSRDWSEPAGEERLWDGARAFLRAKPLERAEMGDVILFRMRSGAVAKHLGLQSGVGPAPRFIHSMSGHGVLESRLTAPWQRRVVARFALPTPNTGG